MEGAYPLLGRIATNLSSLDPRPSLNLADKEFYIILTRQIIICFEINSI